MKCYICNRECKTTQETHSFETPRGELVTSDENYFCAHCDEVYMTTEQMQKLRDKINVNI